MEHHIGKQSRIISPQNFRIFSRVIYQIWNQSSSTNVSDGLLGWLRLLLALNDRHQRDMNLQEVAFSSSSLQLSHSLNKWSTLNISNGTPQLNDTNIWSLLCVVDRNSRDSLDPVLNCIGQMWHNLDSLSKIIASTFTLDDMLIDFARGDVVFASKGDIEIALVVSKIKIDFSSVIENKDLSMPTHSPISSIRDFVERRNRRTREDS